MTQPSAQTLADFPELLSNARIEPIRDRLAKELRLPDEVSFASYIQPEQWIERKGITVKEADQAFFLVLSPNPHPRHPGRTIKSFAFCRLSDWREQEGEAWRYVGVGDPAYPIYKSLSGLHMVERKNWQELD